MKSDSDRKLYYFFAAQLFVAAVLSLFFFFFISSHAACSALIGGLVSFVPGYLFAYMLFRYKGAKHAPEIIKAFYLGEVMKLAVSGALFAVVFMTMNVHALAFFITFIFVQALYWCAPLILT